MDPQLIFFGVIIVVIIALMFRNGRKRQRDQQALSTGLRPGAEIMTSFGVYGTIVAVDDEENRITLRTGPTSELTIHRQAVGRVVTPVADDTAEPDGDPRGAELNGTAISLEKSAADPEFGQRIDADPTDAAGRRSKADGE